MAAALGRRALLAAASAALRGRALGLTARLPAPAGAGGPSGARPLGWAEASLVGRWPDLASEPSGALEQQTPATPGEVAEWARAPRVRKGQELELLEDLLSRWGAGSSELELESASDEQERAMVAEADKTLAILQGIWDTHGLDSSARGAQGLARAPRTARGPGGRRGGALGTQRRTGGGGPEEPPRLAALRRAAWRPPRAGLGAAAGAAGRGGERVEPPSLVAGTRYFGAGEQDYQKLLALNGSLQRAGVRTLLVAVNAAQDRTNATARLRARRQPAPAAAGAATELRVEVMPVLPWSVTAPLNAMLRAARAPAVNASHLLLVSVEVSVTPAAVRAMVQQVDDSGTLVAGVALPGHRPWGTTPAAAQQCSDGSAMATTGIEGDTVPWNTLALWNVDKLSRTGFLAGADFQDPAGMEEAAPIALLQLLLGPSAARAKLLHLPAGQGAAWTTGFEDDPERAAKQALKMATKRKRVQLQLAALGGLQGTVEQWAPCAA